MTPRPKLWPLLLFCCALVVLPSPAIADEQSDDFGDADLREFLLERRQELNTFGRDIKQEYQGFIAENDRDFAAFLKGSWEEFASETPIRLLPKPKPVDLPQFPPAPPGAKPQPPPQPVRIVITTPTPPAPTPPPRQPVIPVPAPPLPPQPEPVQIARPQPPAPPQALTPGPTKPSVTPAPVTLPLAPTPPTVPVQIAQPQPPAPPPALTPAPAQPPVKPVPVTAPIAPVPPAVPKPAAGTGRPVQFDYFGTEVQLRVDPHLGQANATPISNDTISRYWENAAKSDFKPLLAQTLQYRETLRLNDWGYLLLLDQAAAKLLDDPNRNNRALFCWFMLTKAGYDCKIGFRDDRITILLPTDGQLYGLFYFTIGSKRYYAINPGPQGEEIGKIFTYRGSYPGADTPLDFAVHAYPALRDDPQTRQLSFHFAERDYRITVTYNRNSITYFQFYPQNEVAVYADAQLPNLVRDSLLAQLQPLVAGKPATEAVNLLLRFTQTAFQYKTDADQFNREKFFFPEETLYYPYSDCEDRAILFSYLVRRLLGLEVVLLSYPNHIATAVRLGPEAKGDQVVVDGVPYTICDPTYINADLGHAMPQFREVTPKVIPL